MEMMRGESPWDRKKKKTSQLKKTSKVSESHLNLLEIFRIPNELLSHNIHNNPGICPPLQPSKKISQPVIFLQPSYIWKSITCLKDTRTSSPSCWKSPMALHRLSLEEETMDLPGGLDPSTGGNRPKSISGRLSDLVGLIYHQKEWMDPLPFIIFIVYFYRTSAFSALNMNERKSSPKGRANLLKKQENKNCSVLILQQIRSVFQCVWDWTVINSITRKWMMCFPSNAQS